MVQFLRATDTEPIIQKRTFKPFMCTEKPIFEEINTVKVYNDIKTNRLACQFLDRHGELITRDIKLKKLHGKKIIHITYKNQMYVLMQAIR